MAVSTAQTKIKLVDGSTSNVTVSAALKWTRKHLEKTNISGYGTITTVLQMLIDDMTMDIVPHTIAEPVTTDDKSYIREVFASLTPEQVEKYGDGETKSSVTLIKNVLEKVADTKMSIYVTHATTFNAFSATIDSHAVRGRFLNFTSVLNEVRYHKMFEPKDAIKKLVAVITPNLFLVNEVISMWSVSAKGQSTLTAILKYVKEEVDVPSAPAETPKKQKSSQWQSKGGKGKGSGGKGGKSGKSQSSQGRNRNTSNGPSASGGGTWTRRNLNSEPDNSASARAARVNHLRSVAEQQQQYEREAHRDERINALADTLDNYITASTINMMNGATFRDCHDSNAACDDASYDASEYPVATDVATVLQVRTKPLKKLTPSNKMGIPKALTELARLRRAAKVASISSACKLSKGPIIDTATDTDVIGTDSVACATNVQTCEPFEFETISGGGVSNKRGDLSTPLLTLEAAPIVDTAHTSIVSADTVHRNGISIVSSSEGMSLHKDGVACEAVPDGVMYRLPVVDVGKVDDEINLAVALHKKTVASRVLKRMILHRN